MSTKKQIAEEAFRIVAGGSVKPDETINIREMMLALDQIRDEMVRFNFLTQIRDTGEYYVEPDYLTYFDNSGAGYNVTMDTVLGYKYTALPARVITLPHEMGIYTVSPLTNQENPFIRIPPGALGLFRGSQALNNELNTYYWTVNERIYFKNIDASVSAVIFNLVIPGSYIDENVQYAISPDDENKLRNMLVERFAPMKAQPHDETENYQKNS